MRAGAAPRAAVGRQPLAHLVRCGTGHWPCRPSPLPCRCRRDPATHRRRFDRGGSAPQRRRRGRRRAPRASCPARGQQRQSAVVTAATDGHEAAASRRGRASHRPTHTGSGTSAGPHTGGTPPHTPAPPLRALTSHHALSTVLGPAATSTAAASRRPGAAAGHEGGRRPPRPRGRRRAPRAVGGGLRDGDAHPPCCDRPRQGRVSPGRAAAPVVAAPRWLPRRVAQAATRRRSHHGCPPTTLLAAPRANDAGRRRQSGGGPRVGRRVGQRRRHAAPASRRGGGGGGWCTIHGVKTGGGGREG